MTIAPESPSIRCLSGSASAIARRNSRRVVGVVEDAGDEDHRQEHRVHVGRARSRSSGSRARARRRATRSRRRRARRTRPARPSPCGQSSPNTSAAGDRDQPDLDRRVRHRVAGDPGQVGGGRQRRAAHALEHAGLAQVGDVHRERGERRRHHRHAGDAGHDDLQVRVLAGEDRAEQRQEQQRQQEVEERGARVAPEHPALEPVLAPGRRRATATVRARARAGRTVGVVAHAAAGSVGSVSSR